MSEPLEAIDYEQLTLAELEAAAKSQTKKELCAHLDQAADYAALSEEARRARPSIRFNGPMRLVIERTQGDNAPAQIAERVAGALPGDDAGVARFREIAARLDQLMIRSARQ